MESKVPYIDDETSKRVDEELMSTYQYSIDQLMEVAGLTVSMVTMNEIISKLTKKNIKILCICGPGNNGGDGLVASRYLKENNFDVDIFYPKQNTKNELYKRLVNQCENYGIKILKELNSDYNEYDLILDAIFGFSFHGDIREPFKNIIEKLGKVEDKVISVDVPSGFDVIKGNINNTFTPKYLISLTLPKLCSKDFKGEHYLGGRFVPTLLYEKLNIKIEGKIYNDNKLYTKIE